MPGVLVVGAGPTGLTLALQLARYGVPVRIIDAAYSPAMESRALGIQARTLELFERMDVIAPFLERGLRYRQVFVHSERKQIVHETLEQIRSRYNYLLAIPQNETERILWERLRSLDVNVERGLRLVYFEQDPSKVRVHLRGSDGDSNAEFSYVVGCDGAHSTVRHVLDVPFTGTQIPDSFALADLTIDVDLPRDAISVYLVGGNIAAIFPLPKDLWRVIIERIGGFESAPSLDDFRSALYLGGVQAQGYGDPVWVAQFSINQRRVASMAKGRVFLAGDASHIHSPIGAQGMNTGIQDAENLAWKLALTYRYGASESLLASYAIERQSVAARLVRATGSFTKLVASRSPAVRAVRDHLAAFATSIPAVSDRFRDAISELDIIYERSPAVAAGGHTPNPRPGAHAPDASLVFAENGERTSLFALMASLRYVLLVFTYRRDQFVHETLVALERYGRLVQMCLVVRDPSVAGAHLLDPTGTAFRTYGVDGEPQYVLIRPDGYVGARGALRDYGRLLAYLDGMFKDAEAPESTAGKP